MTWLLRLLPLLTLVVVTPSAAWADSNATLAEALFSDGRSLMEQEKYDEACAKFAESQRLDPGTGTLLNLANCYERAGRTATAWATWKEAASSARSAGQDQREQLARNKAAELEPKLARLTIVVPEESRVPGLTVTRNGEELSEVIWGSAIPVDPGTVEVTAEAQGYAPWSTSVDIAAKDDKSVEVPALEATGEPIASEDGSEMTSTVPPGDGIQDRPHPRRIAGYVVGGVGLVGMGVGGVLGVLAIDKNSQSDKNCIERQDALDACNQTGLDLRNQARSLGDASTVVMGIGAAAAITGAVLAFTAPKSQTRVSIAPGAGGATLNLSGSF